MEKEPVNNLLKNKTAIWGAIAVAVILLVVLIAPKFMGGTQDEPSADPRATATIDPNQIDHEKSAEPTPAPASPSATPTAEATAEPSETYSPDGPLQLADGEAHHEVDITDPSDVISEFAKAWGTPGEDKMAWLTSMRPYITDKMYDGFTSTDLEFVPSDKFRSAEITDNYELGYVKFGATYEDGGRLADGVALLQNDGTWLVDALVPGGDLDLD